MTQAESKAGDKAYSIHQGLVSYRAMSKKEEWDLAKLLYVLRRNELWRFAVGGFDSWEDYLKQPDVNLSRHKADKLVRVYEFFVVERGYTVANLWEVPWYALDYISKKGGDLDPEEINSLLDDSKHLTQKDFKENFFDVKDGGDRTYTFVVMRKCDQTGNLEKVHGLESNFIKDKLGL